MWKAFASIILRLRFVLCAIILLITAGMAFLATQVEITYDFPKIIPKDHPDYIIYENFKAQYGEDGDLMVIGIEDNRLFELDFFADWWELGEQYSKKEGVLAVVSIPQAFNVVKDTSTKSFKPQRIFPNKPQNRQQLDSLSAIFKSLKFYDGMLYNSETQATFLALKLDNKVLDNEERIAFVNEITNNSKWFADKYNADLKLSGLPYIRTYKVTKSKKEIAGFLMWSALLITVILILLFRSLYPVLFPMLIVGISIIWAFGSVVLMGYKITLLTGLIPSLMVVIGVPNSVYFINKFQDVFKQTGNKVEALSLALERIGQITFFANLTTAIGFGVFAFMESDMLYEFGYVAAFNIAATYFISMVMIPTIFSVLPAPKPRDLKHLDSNLFSGLLNKIIFVVGKRTNLVLLSLIPIIIIAVPGLMRMEAQGFLFDDVPASNKESKDLRFFEQQFGGLMPLNIIIDTKKKGGAIKGKNLKRANKLQAEIEKLPEFSKPLSLVDGLKFANQAFYNGNEKYYELPSGVEKNFVLSYLKNSGKGGEQNELLNRLTDSTQQVIRISTQIKDIGSKQFPAVVDSLMPTIHKYFPTDKYDTTITGTSSIAYAGYNYLIKSLMSSVAIAFLLIAFIIGYLFRSVKMLLIALLPNFVPLLITATIMGWNDIFLKPSTVLIFSVAFGISVDFTIHFLAKFRQEKQLLNDAKLALAKTIRETGFSMIYTAIILFCGFIVFAFSEFQGTFYLGILTSVTLGVSLLTNLILLPSVIKKIGL